MARNVRTYDHFCLLARALERVGDRWSLLVVRDLLTGPKRFTDLVDRLGGITPKTLTQRLRELEGAGLATAERRPGRREVHYRLTPAGEDLAPAVEALSWWAWRHAWRPPRPGEALHAEHLLRAVVLHLDHAAPRGEPALWHVRLTDDGEYTIEADGSGWAITAGPPPRAPEVTATATTGALAAYLAAQPTPANAAEAGVSLTGPPAEVKRFTALVGTFGRAARDRDPQPAHRH